MPPQTDLIQSAAGAPSGPRHPSLALGGAPRPRRGIDRGALWVRITLAIVVSALLVFVVGSNGKSSRKLAPRGPATTEHPEDL